MTQSFLQQLQMERIATIADNHIDDLKDVGSTIPASIDTRLPYLQVLLGAPVDYERIAANTYNVTTTWDLFLYLAPAGQDLDKVNESHLYVFLDTFANTFLARHRLQYNGASLAYCRDTEFQMVSGISQPMRYPPRQGQALYRGCQYRLTVYSTNYTVQNST